MIYDVFGMCNALYDIQAEIDDGLLAELRGFGIEKGGMFLLDEGQQKEIVSRVYTHLVNAEPGGSGATTFGSTVTQPCQDWSLSL